MKYIFAFAGTLIGIYFIFLHTRTFDCQWNECDSQTPQNCEVIKIELTKYEIEQMKAAGTYSGLSCEE